MNKLVSISVLIIAISSSLFFLKENVYAKNRVNDFEIIYKNNLVELSSKSIILDGIAYLSIEDFCKITNSKYQMDQAKKVIELRTADDYFSFSVNSQFIVINNECRMMPKAFLSNNRVMVPLRYFFEELSYNLDWNEKHKVVVLTPPESESNSTFESAYKTISLEHKLYLINYTSEDLYWLSRIVNAEARGESYQAKVAVANVILNRVASKEYPDTIKSVIFDKKFGVQFQPVSNNAIYQAPSQECTNAALEALENADKKTSGALFFINPRIAQSSWVSSNRKFAFRLENHDFYY